MNAQAKAFLFTTGAVVVGVVLAGNVIKALKSVPGFKTAYETFS